MSYKESCNGCPRLPVWSSPKVLVRGEPAGTAERSARDSGAGCAGGGIQIITEAFDVDV